jgi:phage shock protein A
MACAYFLLGIPLSEVKKFSSSNIRGWLESETSSIFVPVQAKAQKLLDEMRKTLESLAQTTKMLLENSVKEIEKRNMKTYRRARALNKLTRLFSDRMRQIRVPNKVTYDSFHEFAQETQKAFSAIEADIRNWFPRISPFFILDRRKFSAIFEKAKALLKELNDFLGKEYVKTKTLEETFQVIDKVQALEEKLADLGEQRKKVEDEKAAVEKKIAETLQKMEDLKSKEKMSQLAQTGNEIEALRIELKRRLRHLRKPFLKLQSLAIRGKGSGLTPEELRKLDQYMENPFEAFATEDSGYPLLRQILQKLELSTSDGKLKLKADKMRKAEQDIDSIVNQDSLMNLHQKCREMILRKRQLSTSAEVTETRSDLSNCQEHLENLERKKVIVESKQHVVNQAYNETLEKIQNHRTTIEKNVFDFMDKRIHVE